MEEEDHLSTTHDEIELGVQKNVERLQGMSG